MISFLGREDRVTKSGGPVTTLNLFVVKASYEIICFPAKSHWGSKQCPSQNTHFAEEHEGMEEPRSCPTGNVLPHTLWLLELMQVCFPTSVNSHSTKVGRSFLRFFIYCEFIKNSAGLLSPMCFTVILGMGENEISASLSQSGSTANQVVCTCWNSPPLFMFARSLCLWAAWGMIGSERKILMKLFLPFIWNFSVPTQYYIVKKNSSVFGEAFLCYL